MDRDKIATPEEIVGFRAALIWLVATEGASAVRSGLEAGAKAHPALAAETRYPGPSAGLMAHIVLAGRHDLLVGEVVKAVGRSSSQRGGASPIQKEHRRLRSTMVRLYRGERVEFQEAWIDEIGKACAMREPAVSLLRHELTDFEALRERPLRFEELHYALIRYIEVSDAGEPSVTLKPVEQVEPPPRLIGREQELDEIRKLLISKRLVTLRGAGGCGKTRLAQEVSNGSFGELPPRIAWLSLDELAPSTNIAEYAASNLLKGSRKSAPALEDLEELLSDDAYLLILDNCEHVLQSASTVVGRLLAHCRGLRVLATSREPLGVAGEKVHFIDGLMIPPATVDTAPELLRYSSAELFAERANDRTGFIVRAEDVRPIQEICFQLEGIPLAIELAAGWVGIMSCAEIAEGLKDRFGLLIASGRRQHARHQTMEATIAWSFALLSDRERTVWEWA